MGQPIAKSKHERGSRGSKRIAAGLVLAAFIFCILVNMVPAIRSGDLPDTVLSRYFPVALTSTATFILLIAGFPRFVFMSKSVVLPLTILATAMIIGGLINLSNGAPIEETFTGRGLTLLSVFVGAVFALSGLVDGRFVNRLVNIGSMAGAAMLGMMLLDATGLAFQQYNHILREESVIGIAFLAAWCRQRKSTLVRIYVLGACVAYGILMGKATLLLCALAFFMMTWGTQILSRSTGASRGINRNFASQRLIIFLASLPLVIPAAIFATNIVTERLQRYDRDLRLKMWGDIYNRFLESPIYGNFFTESPLYFEPLLPDRLIPSHNDPLDILAHGGLLYFSAFIIAVFGILLYKESRRLWFQIDRTDNISTPFWCLSIFSLISLTGNPIMSNPRIGFVLFFAIGAFATFSAAKRQRATLNNRSVSAKSTDQHFNLRAL